MLAPFIPAEELPDDDEPDIEVLNDEHDAVHDLVCESVNGE